MDDKSDPVFWQSIKPGDIVTLTDARTIEASRKAGHGLEGIDYTVKSATRLKEMSEKAEWRFLELDGDDRELQLVVKIVDQDLSIGAMEPLDIPPGTRDDLIDEEFLWIFNPPKDQDDFDPDELSYADVFPKELGDGSELRWFKKPQGELAAKVANIPEQSGMEELLATVVEYGGRERFHGDDQIEDDVKDEPDELYVIEKGEVEEGYVEFFGLWALAPGDVDVLRR